MDLVVVLSLLGSICHVIGLFVDQLTCFCVCFFGWLVSEFFMHSLLGE